MCMSVYIENVITDNFVITYLISRLSFKMGGVYSCKFRCIVAAIVGTVVAIVYPFIENNVILLLVKAGLYIVLCVILYFGKRKKTLSLYFLLLTLLFGGILLALVYAVDNSVYAALRGVYVFSPGILIGVCFLAYKMLAAIHVKTIKLNECASFIFRVEITALGGNYEISGLLDTGNKIYDSVTGLPVILIDRAALCDQADESVKGKISECNYKKIDGFCGYIRVRSVGQIAEKIPIFVIKKAVMLCGDTKKEFTENLLVGITDIACADNVDYQGILHPAMIKGGI